MASDRGPKFIQISQGEHALSPHLTSLRNDELHRIQVQPPTAPEPVADIPAALDLDIDFSHASSFAPLPEPPITAPPEPPRAAAAPLPVKKPTATPAPAPKPAAKPQKITATKKQTFEPGPARHPAISRRRASLAFVMVALLLVTPLKALTTYQRLAEAKTDVEQLKSVAAGDVGASFSEANTLITEALRSFHSANTTLSGIDAAEEFVLRHTPFFGEKFGAASRMVAAGEHTSLAAASYMQLFRTLKAKSDAPLIERLTIFFEGNRAVLSSLEAAADLVRPIDVTDLPAEQQAFVANARAAILALYNDAHYLSSAGPVILSTLGSASPRRYLVVFQNPTELRATGGFIGSFAIVDIENGEIKRMDVPAGGSYDLQGALKKHVHAPLPLHIINSRWEFQDGNWFPDFPTSAQKLMWFLEKSQGPSVDGVIAINATVLPELLAVVGPVKLGPSGEELSEANALETIRESINERADLKSAAPKQVITEAAPAVIETLKAGKAEHFLAIITTLLKSLERRDIQLYAKDEDLQRQIAEFGWEGSIRDNPSGDYLSVIATNIGGQKTDALIAQTIDHQAKIETDGTVRVTVRVKRAQARSTKALEGGQNVSYVRFYVPKGSRLETADGFDFPSETMFRASETWEQEDTDLKKIERELGTHPASGTRITEEFGHTVFGNWMLTNPGAATEAAITYVLPFKVQPPQPTGLARVTALLTEQPPVASYSVYLQRQSGAANTDVSSRVILPDGWELSWVTDQRAQIAENGALLSLPFSNDIYFAVTAYAETNNASNTENSSQKED